MENGGGVCVQWSPVPCRSSMVLLKLLPFHSFQSLWREGSGQHFVFFFLHHVDKFTDQWAANTEHVFKAAAAFVSGVFLSCCSDFSVTSATGFLLVSLAIPVIQAASLGPGWALTQPPPHQLDASGTRQKCPSLPRPVTQAREGLLRVLIPHITAVIWKVRVSHRLCNNKDLKI